ncbi:MAG TPA: histidine kinase [Bacteroidales bacterium]|nr:histidine kinase [Bacteroidales bacterium]
MYFLPPLGSKYKLVVEERLADQSSSYYFDLNSDGVSEYIITGKGLPYYHVLVQDDNGRVYDQWNLKENLYPGISECFFGNFDNDNYAEIYIFSFKGDSLFLNINEFFDPNGLVIESMYLTKIGIVDGVITTNAVPAGFYDRNGDGFCELYFLLQTGFALEPRRVYSLDFINRNLNSSQFTGCMFYSPFFTDSDGDNKPEIFGKSRAAGNYNMPVPFTDWSTWFMVFNENLRFEFPPVEFPGLTNELEVYPYKHDKFRGYILSHNTSSADSTVIKPRIMVFSLDGKLIRERAYSDFGFKNATSLLVMGGYLSDRIYIFGNELIELNSELEVLNRVNSPFRDSYFSYKADIDNDGLNEFVFYSYLKQKLSIYNASLKLVAETSLKGATFPFRFSHYFSADKVHKLLLSDPGHSCFIMLNSNDLFYLTYLAYPFVYLLLVLFIYIINRINTTQVLKREDLKQRLLTLQLQGIKSQFDPHFTFNSLNSIASLIYLEERQTAYDYLNKFTTLMRRMLNDADRIYRSIGEEIDFVTTYLDLEKMRFGNKLDYSVKLDEEVTGEESVPKLVLHTFAENAIKHGITPGEGRGMLQIIVARESDYLKIIIEDNGIGRARSAGKSHSTGKGLKLTGEFYDILNQLNKRPVTHSIIDLYDDSGDPAGTRVEVFVPLDLDGDR